MHRFLMANDHQPSFLLFELVLTFANFSFGYIGNVFVGSLEPLTLKSTLFVVKYHKIVEWIKDRK